MKTPPSARHLFLFLLLLVLLPALFYSAYEINTLSSSEELIGEVYRRQLDAVLFSVNQYAWDAASGWANTISRTIPEGAPSESGHPFRDLLGNTPALQALVLADTGTTAVRLIAGKEGGSLPPHADVTRKLRGEKERINRLLRLQTSDYRKLEAIPLGDTTAADPPVMLAFIASQPGAPSPVLAGMILNPELFVRNVLGQKITEGAGEEFILAVFRRGASAPIFATGSGPAERYQQKRLWLFPHLSLGIQLKGTTIDDLVRSRFRRNVVLILILDLVLLVGAWLVYRTLRREIELARMKSEFVSNVSHELRTPLSLIRMFAETLELGRVPTEEKKKEYYVTILQETERLTRLINNILNFSRMEAGKKQYAFAPVAVNDTVRRIVATYSHQLGQSGFTLREEYAPDLPMIHADREALSEALINIIDNAIKYSGDQRSIAIRTAAGTGTVTVQVEDRGIGIAPEHQKKIFEKFYRVSNPVVHSTKGSGLGLSLVRHIMDAHGGAVAVASTQGIGSTFTLTFPVGGPGPAPTTRQKQEEIHA